MLVIASVFVSFAVRHPELSFPWSLRATFLFYGMYIWFLFKFLVEIPFGRKNRAKKGNHIIKVIIFSMMAIVFFVMEITGDKVDVYTILRGFVVVGSCDVVIDSIYKGVISNEKK